LLIESAADTQRKWERYARARSTRARDQLLLDYLPLVRRVALRLIATLPRSVRLDDLISAGVVGLLSSVDSFNPKLGNKFETFAVNRIRGAMVDSLREMDWVPRSVRQKARRLERTIEELSQKLGHPPADSEIARAMSLTVDEYRKILHETNATILVSLDDTFLTDQGDSAILADLAADTGALTSQERLEERELRDIIVQRLKELPAQEKLVLALYYYEELTFREVGEVLSLTESRVSQIHSQAVSDLRSSVRASFDR